MRTIRLFTVPPASNVKNKMWVPHSQTLTLAGATIKTIYIYKSWKTCTLAKYFIEKQCGLHNLKVTFLEKVKVKTEKYLEKREGHWQRHLFTMHPHSQNIRKEFENGTHKSFFN